MSSDRESITTFYLKRTLRKSPAGSQVSYSYSSPKPSDSVSSSYRPARARDSVSSSYRPSYSSRSSSVTRPAISTYRRRKYPTQTPYHIWDADTLSRRR